MSAHVLLNLLNELGKRDKMRGLPSILSLFRNEFNKFNNTSLTLRDVCYNARWFWTTVRYGSRTKYFKIKVCVIEYVSFLGDLRHNKTQISYLVFVYLSTTLI